MASFSYPESFDDPSLSPNPQGFNYLSDFPDQPYYITTGMYMGDTTITNYETNPTFNYLLKSPFQTNIPQPSTGTYFESRFGPLHSIGLDDINVSQIVFTEARCLLHDWYPRTCVHPRCRPCVLYTPEQHGVHMSHTYRCYDCDISSEFVKIFLLVNKGLPIVGVSSNGAPHAPSAILPTPHPTRPSLNFNLNLEINVAKLDISP